jgi:hypothetical protein
MNLDLLFPAIIIGIHRSLALVLLLVDNDIFVVAGEILLVMLSEDERRRFLLTAPFFQILFIIVNFSNFKIHAIEKALEFWEVKPD